MTDEPDHDQAESRNSRVVPDVDQFDAEEEYSLAAREIYDSAVRTILLAIVMQINEGATVEDIHNLCMKGLEAIEKKEEH